MLRIQIYCFFILVVSSELPVNLLHAQMAEIDTQKPWVYWWWPGSAVNNEGITWHLENYAKAGIGGVHIIPIYGVKGVEPQFTQFLSEDWVQHVNYTIAEAKRLNMAVDITPGTGWPFGGNKVSIDDAPMALYTATDTINANARIEKTIILEKNLNSKVLVNVIAYNAIQTINLKDSVGKGVLKATLPHGPWIIGIIVADKAIMKVKRAAPGGEGYAVNYLNPSAGKRYFEEFDSLLMLHGYHGGIRSTYNDSYEILRGNWAEELPSYFLKNRGYSFYDSSRYWFESGAKQQAFLYDYRLTVHELLCDFTREWVQWSHLRKSLTRNQAHGSPANILDLYALADIPETESFGPSYFPIPYLRIDSLFDYSTYYKPDPIILKMASSAANVCNKPLASSETCTWLADHFNVSLSQIKPQIDELFLSGINHVFYHGTTYSPKEAAWPGWLFYASTNFGISSHFWEELPLLNTYVKNCQAILQESEPSKDIALYFPIHDLWQLSADERLKFITVHDPQKWLIPSKFYTAAIELLKNNVSFDYISDKQLQDGMGDAYKKIVIPACKYMPEATKKALLKRVDKVLFIDETPASTPGLRGSAIEWTKAIHIHSIATITNTLNDDIEIIGSSRFQYLKKKFNHGYVYFVANLDAEPISIQPRNSGRKKSYELYNPLTNERGFLKVTHQPFILLPGESMFVFVYDTIRTNTPFIYTSVNFQKRDTLKGPWRLAIDTLTFNLNKLDSWTNLDSNLQYYYGKGVYTTQFTINPLQINDFVYLNLKNVSESAEISINGFSLGKIWCLPYRLRIPKTVLKETNEIKIIVKNLSANQIIAYDQQKVLWKKFYDINMVHITYKPFDAKNWMPRISGLTESPVIEY